MTKRFDAETSIVYLNTLRVQLSNTTFTEDTIRKGFKNCKIPSNALFWSEFRNSGIVIKVGEDLYCFKNPNKPIHFRMLNEIYKRYKDRADLYYNKWYDKKRRKNVLKNSEIQAAIKLLNDNGFEVLRRIVLNK